MMLEMLAASVITIRKEAVLRSPRHSRSARRLGSDTLRLQGTSKSLPLTSLKQRGATGAGNTLCSLNQRCPTGAGNTRCSVNQRSATGAGNTRCSVNQRSGTGAGITRSVNQRSATGAGNKIYSLIQWHKPALQYHTLFTHWRVKQQSPRNGGNNSITETLTIYSRNERVTYTTFLEASDDPD